MHGACEVTCTSHQRPRKEPFKKRQPRPTGDLMNNKQSCQYDSKEVTD